MGRKKTNEIIPAVSPTFLTESLLKDPSARLAMPFGKEIFVLRTYVAGVAYIRGIKKLAKALNVDDEVRLVREPKNPYDELAILVKNSDNRKLGYIPRQNNSIIARLMDGGMMFKAKIENVILYDESDADATYALSIFINVYMVV